ncbi:MAG: universal stress protein [Ilumatobacteraceae bacterium]
MSNKIIVGVDGSDTSFEALRWAVYEAGRRSAEIKIVSCYTAPAYGGLGGAVYPTAVELETLKDESAELVQRAVDIAVGIDRELVVEGVTLMSSPVVGLAESALPGDQIVVGTTGHTGLVDGLVGSVTTGVTHRAHVPVVVVPFKASTKVGAAMKRIVVGVDGSPESLRALAWAYDEALASGAVLDVVHAWAYPYSVSRNSMREVRKPMEFEAVNELQTSLDSLGARLTEGSVVVNPKLCENTPAEALLKAGSRADLIVVGSRGRGGLRSVLLGSVSRSVMYHALCPVAVVRTDGCRSLHHRVRLHHDSHEPQVASAAPMR